MAEQDIKEERICSCRSQHFPQLCNPWSVVACLLVCLWDLLWTELERNSMQPPLIREQKPWLSWPELTPCAYQHALASFAGEFIEHLAIKAENSGENLLLLNHVKMYAQTHMYTHGRLLTHKLTHTLSCSSCLCQLFLPLKCVHYHSIAWLPHHHREPWAIHSGFNGDDANPWLMRGPWAKICTPVPQLSPRGGLANSKQESTTHEEAEPAFQSYDIGFIHTKLDVYDVFIKNIR
jgi:hypothetical protein